jgi:hypothetical protein
MINLKAKYGKVYRITLDESAAIEGQTKAERLWCYRIKCLYGHIYVHGENRLGAFSDRPVVGRRLMALPCVTPHQRGDREFSATFDPADFAQVARLLRPYVRRQLSPEQKAAGAERLRAWREGMAKGHCPDPIPGPS